LKCASINRFLFLLYRVFKLLPDLAFLDEVPFAKGDDTWHPDYKDPTRSAVEVENDPAIESCVIL
jgi:hypothetical protein